MGIYTAGLFQTRLVLLQSTPLIGPLCPSYWGLFVAEGQGLYLFAFRFAKGFSYLLKKSWPPLLNV